MIPKNCPVCHPSRNANTRPDYDFPESMRNCDNCGSEWNEHELTLDARGFFTDEENEKLGRNKELIW
jgi:hypothetical protein